MEKKPRVISIEQVRTARTKITAAQEELIRINTILESAKADYATLKRRASNKVLAAFMRERDI